MSNIFDNPEHFGLKIWDSVDTAASYEFCETVIFSGPLGELTYAQDLGCSCPVPFEDVKLGDLKLITLESFDAFEAAVKAHHEYTSQNLDKLQQMVQDVRMYLKDRERGVASR